MDAIIVKRSISTQSKSISLELDQNLQLHSNFDFQPDSSFQSESLSRKMYATSYLGMTNRPVEDNNPALKIEPNVLVKASWKTRLPSIQKLQLNSNLLL